MNGSDRLTVILANAEASALVALYLQQAIGGGKPDISILTKVQDRLADIKSATTKNEEAA